MDKQSQIDFIELIDKIVLANYPEHIEIYEFEKEALVESLFDKPFDENAADLGVNKFGELGEVLSYMSTIAGTFLTFLKIYGWFKDNKSKSDIQKTVSDLWKQNMIKEGLSEEQAELISEKYKDDILKAIKGKL